MIAYWGRCRKLNLKHVNLRGQVEAMKAQVAELMQVLAANKP